MKYIFYVIGGFFEFVFLFNIYNAFSSYFRGYELIGPTLKLVVVLAIAAILTAFATRFFSVQPPEVWQQWWVLFVAFLKEHKVFLFGAAIATTLGILSIGITGLPVMIGADWVVEALFARPLGWKQPHGDSAWPTILMYATVVPWLSFGCYLAIRKISALHGVALAAVTFTVMIGVCFLLQLSYRFSNR